MRTQKQSVLRSIAWIGAAITLGLARVATAGPSEASGEVRGRITIGPNCPGPARLSEDETCVRQPVQTTVEIFATSGERAAPERETPLKIVFTDQKGAFRVHLPPGVYRLAPVPSPGTLTSKPREIVVAAGSVTDIELSVDTGLR